MSETAMLARWDTLACSIARRYYLPGADADDVLQEARVGLLDAHRCYRPALGGFGPFAATVIHRHLMDAVTRARSGKHRLLTEAARGGTSEDGVELEIVDLIPGGVDPAERYEQAALFRRVVSAFATLSQAERHALIGILNGTAYRSLGEKKCVDNAAQRARRKLRLVA